MRTIPRDQTGLATFGAYIVDAASGGGMASGGLPYTFTRTSTGVYVFHFDFRLTPLHVTAVCYPSGGPLAMPYTFGPGSFTVVGYSNFSATAANANFFWTCTALDKR